MAKQRSSFVCSECGSSQRKWMGKCPDCGQWDTLVEEAVRKEENRASRTPVGAGSVQPITQVVGEHSNRISTGDAELDRILGGGLVAGSAILLGGDPGIGKSTILLQAALRLASEQAQPIFYVTAEESGEQLRLRAERVGELSDNLYVLPENNVNHILRQAEKLGPALIIIDSIQMVFWPEIDSAPGSVSQVRESAAGLVAFAKRTGCPLFLVGHVTKEGSLAGPKVLEHMVDVVLYFEGERHHAARILRGVKNRFGATGEIGIFEMGDGGLRPVADPSRLFLSGAEESCEGSMVTSSMEGTRPFLVEVQALVSPGLPGGARRRISGADSNRVSMLLAVLEKRCDMTLYDQDVFVNIVGGVELQEPSADLAITLAIASSLQERALPRATIAVGEVGLGGEVRHVSGMEPRLREAVRLGFARAIIPAGSGKDICPKGMELTEVKRVEAALEILDAARNAG